MKTRLVGLLLLVLLTIAALLAGVHLLLRIIINPDDQAREMLAGLDVFGNSGLLSGSRWETISSHTGREAALGTPWAVWLSAALDVLQPGHCAGANALEQPLLDAIKNHKT